MRLLGSTMAPTRFAAATSLLLGTACGPTVDPDADSASGTGGDDTGSSSSGPDDELPPPDEPPPEPDTGEPDDPPDCENPSPGMVCVPGGPFQYGCIAGVEEFGSCFPEPTMSEAFLPTFEIDAHEVTVAAYWACVDAGACTPPAPGEGLLGEVQTSQIGWDYPINCVDWAQAVAYCEWMGKRLPTAMEWEKAARGTDGRLFPWGDEPPDCSRVVWWPDYPDGPGPYPAGAGCDTGAPQPVGSRPAGASPYGALDMAGNVSEWVADDATNVSGDEPSKMLRGGAFLHHEPDVLYAFRQLGFTAVGDGNMFNGFRCARGP